MSYRTLAELLPVLAVLLLAGFAPRVAVCIAAVPSQVLRRLAHGSARAVLWSTLLTLVSCALLSWLNPPKPRVVDEFSYLLAADTFAHGRLTNPSSPVWAHFETLHVLPSPTYQSKYPPGQGLFLAIGQAAAGRAIVGVWLSMGAGAAALCWMLSAWMPPHWALFGALLPVLRFGALAMWDENWFAYWATTFWGGAVAMLGSALVFGALPRLFRSARKRDGALLGLGLIILANSRPFEGLVAALPVVIALTVWAWSRPSHAGRVTVATGLVLLLGFAAMGYYNYRVTRDFLTMPYTLYADRYDVAPIFIFGDLRTDVTFNHQSIRDYHEGFVVEGYRQKRRGVGLSLSHIALAPRFFWGAVLWLPVLFAFSGPLRGWSVLAALIIVFSILASAVSSYADKLRPHYIAPAAPMFVFLAVAGLRRLQAIRTNPRRHGRLVAQTIVIISLTSVFLGLGFRAIYGAPYVDAPLVRDKPAIIQTLLATEGRDLVMVYYAPGHNPHDEWVYNKAYLKNAPVLWARDMGADKNRALIDYHAGRKIWRLYADEHPPRLELYFDP